MRAPVALVIIAALYLLLITSVPLWVAVALSGVVFAGVVLYGYRRKG